MTTFISYPGQNSQQLDSIFISKPHHGERVSSDEIQQATDELKQRGRRLRRVVSPYGFTPDAKELAKEFKIDLCEQSTSINWLFVWVYLPQLGEEFEAAKI